MKRILKILCVAAVLLCVTANVYAQGNISGIFSGRQDYILLATVVDITGSTIVVDPYHGVYNGENTEVISMDSNIEIAKFRYSYCSEHIDISTTPRVGDNIFVSLNKTADGYTVANGAYRTSSVDYKLLTFYASESMRDKDCLAEIVALAYFVRTDGNLRNFKLDNGTLTVDNDGKQLTLYPTDRINETVTFVNIDGKAIDSAKSKDVIIDGGARPERGYDFRWIICFGVIVISALTGAFVLYNSNGRDQRSTRAKKE